MATISVRDARANLSRLIDRALSGEEIVITRKGKPAIKLVPAERKLACRRLGTLAGEFDIPDEVLLAPLPDDFLAYFGSTTSDEEGATTVSRSGTAP